MATVVLGQIDLGSKVVTADALHTSSNVIVTVMSRR